MAKKIIKTDPSTKPLIKPQRKLILPETPTEKPLITG